jgi:hypothetical protein
VHPYREKQEEGQVLKTGIPAGFRLKNRRAVVVLPTSVYSLRDEVAENKKRTQERAPRQAGKQPWDAPFLAPSGCRDLPYMRGVLIHCDRERNLSHASYADQNDVQSRIERISRLTARWSCSTRVVRYWE